MIMASKASKVRFVICPKCHLHLIEFADIPVYKCGACGVVLKAKNHLDNRQNGASKMVDSTSSEENPLQQVLDVEESSNDVPIFLNKQSALFSTVGNSAEMDHVVDHMHVAVSSEKSSCSNSENNYHTEDKFSKCTENANMEAGLTHDNPCSIQQPGVVGENPIFVASDQQGRVVQSNMDSCSMEQLGDSWKLSRHESSNTCSSGKADATGSLVPKEDVVDGDPGNRSSEKMNAPTARNAYAFDDNVASCDEASDTHEQCLLSSGIVRDQKISESDSSKEQDREEDTVFENMAVELKQDIQSSILSSKSSGERCSSSIFNNSASIQRLSSSHASFKETSQHSEIFHSARKELEDFPLSRSLSSNSSFGNFQWNGQNDGPTKLRNLENDRIELLRKLDELRDHLTRPYAQGQEGNQSFHIRGTKQDLQFHKNGSEQVLRCRNPNITQSHSRVFGQRAIAQQYQSFQVPVSARSNCSCLHHHPKDLCIPVQLPPNVRCRTCKCHIFCHSSTAASPKFFNDCNIAIGLPNSKTSEQNFEKLRCKEKRQLIKRHFRPVSGGAPFVICNNCLQLLQLPTDFLISRARCHKLKCGACYEVNIFLSDGGGHIVPHSSTQLDPTPSEVDNEAEHVDRHVLSVDRSYGHLPGDPVSYSEQYGPPFSIGYSTDGDHMPHISRSSIEHEPRRHGKEAIGSLHQLMGYASASELIYQPSDEDEAYESTDVAPFYRTFDEMHSNEPQGGTRMGSPLQENSEIGYSLEHTEKHKEYGSVKRSTNARGASPLRGIFKKGIKELNHGLENVKLKLHTGGRVIPAP